MLPWRHYPLQIMDGFMTSNTFEDLVLESYFVWSHMLHVGVDFGQGLQGYVGD